MPSPASRHRRVPRWRVALGVVAAAAGSALAGVLLGEYDFSGLLPWVGGPVLGVAVAEVLVAVGGRRCVLLGTTAGAFAAGALLWAARIASGYGLSPAPWGLGPGMAMAVLAAVLWVGPGRPPGPDPARPTIRLRR